MSVTQLSEFNSPL